MAYLYTPDTSQMVNMLEGSLRVTYPVSVTVWKDSGGVWRQQQTPADDDLAVAQMVLLGRPQVVDDATAAELLASGVGGTLAPITIEGQST